MVKEELQSVDLEKFGYRDRDLIAMVFEIKNLKNVSSIIKLYELFKAGLIEHETFIKYGLLLNHSDNEQEVQFYHGALAIGDRFSKG